MKVNPLTALDFYKTDHRRQYPPGTTRVFSNLTARSGKHANVPDRSGIVFFGLQYFLKDFLLGSFAGNFFGGGHHFDNNPDKIFERYKRRMDTSLGVDAVSIDHIRELWELGFLPIEVRAVPEGTFVPVGVPCLTIENTRPEFFWLTNYLETVLSAYLWQPCTSATTARAYRLLLADYAKKTGIEPEFVDFQAHDFSFRGMSSLQTAATSGAGHLLFFKGTDTVPAIDFLEDYYRADAEKELIGASVPATEHSVMAMGGEGDELGTFQRLITELYPSGIVSIVSDTWDFWKVLTEYAAELRPEIMKRNGKVVFRPDSGDPVKIICGDPDAPECTAQGMGAVAALEHLFGSTITPTGHRLLDPHVGLIYGDSITYERAREILERLDAKGYASGNVVFGIGSYTYQHVTRDTWGFAVKATYGVVNGEERNIFKKPKTDGGEKHSAKGLLAVVSEGGRLALRQEVTRDFLESEANMLRPVFRDGTILREQSLGEIRQRARLGE